MEIGVFLTLILVCVHARKSFSWLSEEIGSMPKQVNKMGQNLKQIPGGGFHVVTLNVAYNKITQLTPYVFYLNLYKNLSAIEMGHNRLTYVDGDAFREMRHLTNVDFSNNNITNLDPNVFRHNTKLQKLDVTSNKITTDPEKPFLRSFSLEVLAMSHNRILHVFDITFARLPNLRQLLLDDNGIYYMSKNCFAHLNSLQYVSLARTGVHTVSESMFRKLPRLVDLSGTPLSQKFTPALTRVRTTQLAKLINVERYIFEDDYDT